MKKIICSLLFLLFFSELCFSQECNSSQPPIVFVHGFMGSGDNWATQIQRFSSNGFCEERMFVFDWNSFGGKNNTELLSAFIDRVLMTTGAEKVNLVGHSAGGKLCYDYLSDSVRALKVAHYVHTGSFPMKKVAGENAAVAMMNIYSSEDKVLKNGADIPGAVNIKLNDYDHLQTATGRETFVAMYRFFKGEDPVHADIIAGKGAYVHITIKGMLLGENEALRDDSLLIFLMDPKTGRHQKANDKDKQLGRWHRLDSNGSFKLDVERGRYLEIELRPKNGRRLFYYLEPPARDNHNIYLRALPTTGLASAMLGKIPEDEKQTALVIFTANNAVIAGRDTLAIDSVALSLPGIMPAAKTSVACFVWDDGDSISNRKALKSLGAAPFISGVDIFIKADKNKVLRVYYNGRSMVVPKRKSSEGIVVVVFN